MYQEVQSNMTMNKQHNAFTLIELLLTIAIIALLSSIILTSVQDARMRARDTQRASDVKSIQNALELYRAYNRIYPTTSGASAPNNTWATSNDSSWTTLGTALAPYLRKMPTDPSQSSSGWAGTNATTYAYSITTHQGGCDRQWYVITYRPEKWNANTQSPGVTDCNGTNINYTSIGVVTTGLGTK